ncbi:hypothetical protein EDEG_01478 [Edhazardia aedis USNM 41457]|uniref:Origin recognition complex subunit 2 n=1 Tax=Edhazardia aedis (strain USNM 41457) TaxID=1003232 RepID=J9D903_EDHAE|nr:hypothetical protein EDEG_01478 [Edhazardia aedis USNM 41457]|eukprot:EJW04246.1 hypothetical protein EDEG_01478 [Edhazardia aedis USNM 41457]
MKETAILEKFHLDRKKEFRIILKEYNILFYGYGNKENILKKLFPREFLLNCFLYKTNEIISSIRLYLTKKLKIKKKKHIKLNDFDFFMQIDDYLEGTNNKIILLLLNFDRNLYHLIDIKNIKIIGTLEKIDHEISKTDLLNYNFVLYDLTTFEPYKDELLSVQIEADFDQVECTKKVINNVSKNVQNTFSHLLNAFKEERSFNMKQLQENVGKRILARNASAVIDILKEFIDHEILKKINETEYTILLNSSEICEIISYLSLLKQNRK